MSARVREGIEIYESGRDSTRRMILKCSCPRCVLHLSFLLLFRRVQPPLLTQWFPLCHPLRPSFPPPSLLHHPSEPHAPAPLKQRHHGRMSARVRDGIETQMKVDMRATDVRYHICPCHSLLLHLRFLLLLWLLQ